MNQTERSVKRPGRARTGSVSRAAAPAALPRGQGTLGLYLAVAFGSTIGGSARWAATQLLDTWTATQLPWGTLFVNVTGSFLIGLYAALTSPEGRWLAGPRQRQLVMTGVLGGYTTFSIFSFETLALFQTGHVVLAGISVGASIVGWLTAVWAGDAVGSRFNRLRSS